MKKLNDKVLKELFKAEIPNAPANLVTVFEKYENFMTWPDYRKLLHQIGFNLPTQSFYVRNKIPK